VNRVGKEVLNVNELCGLTSAQAHHYSVYALTQTVGYVYHGEAREVQRGICEKIAYEIDGKEHRKAIFSWTKRKGQDRRMILNVAKGDQSIAERFGCSVPATCCGCPVCLLMGGLKTKGGEGDEARRIVSRLTYVDSFSVEEKPFTTVQRNYAIADVVAPIEKVEKVEVTMPFKVEVIMPGTRFPMVVHGMLLSDFEFGMYAYAFLNGLKHYGASGYKGYELVREENGTPYLIVDKYTVPFIQPLYFDHTETILERVKLVFKTEMKKKEEERKIKDNAAYFERILGNEAEELLRTASKNFMNTINRFTPETKESYKNLVNQIFVGAKNKIKAHVKRV